MKMFVPMEDWDSGLQFRGEALVPYRIGLPVWREPRAAEPARERVESAATDAPVTSTSAA